MLKDIAVIGIQLVLGHFRNQH